MHYPEKAIFTNMCMITKNDQVLVEDRKNPNWRGIVFPGGHVKVGESFVDSTIREVKEETGLTVSNLQLCGIKQFYDNDHNRYVVLMYKTSTFTGELKSSSEGKVFWIKQEDLKQYKLAEDFDSMLRVFEDDDLSENYFYVDQDGNEQVKNK